LFKLETQILILENKPEITTWIYKFW